MKDKENIKELFERFLTANEAQNAAEDTVKGEDLLSKNPAPLPNPMLLEGIKRQMTAHAAAKKRYEAGCRALAIAASITVLVWLGVEISQIQYVEPERTEQTARSLWDDSPNELDTKIAQLESEDYDASLITLEANGSRENIAFEDITAELNEITQSFWEG